MVKACNIKDLFSSFAPEEQKALDRYTSFRVGGPADLLMLPQTMEDVIGIVKTAHQAQCPVTIIGGGTNLLVSDKGIRGVVIILTRFKQDIEQSTPDTDKRVCLTCLAGQRLGTLCRHACDAGLSGLEWAAGIPGTVGGAVMMNAGSFGGDMAGIVKLIEILDLENLKTSVLPKDRLEFSYRQLALENIVVLKIQVELSQADPETVKEKFYSNLKTKQSTQPVSQASAGCFFKNPPGFKSAGYLIEQAGMKSARCNDAVVSNLHANFIVNHGNACASDILNLARQVKENVYEKFGINLKEEVKTIGD